MIEFVSKSIKIVLLIILSTIQLASINAMGLGDWTLVTKSGVVLHNSYGPTYIEWNGERIENVGKWYYYKNNIIGITNTMSWETDTTKYFILNEKSKDLYITSEISSWHLQLRKGSLNPTITRWYSSHMGTFIFVFIAAYYWFISIPIVIICIYAILKLFRKSIKANLNIKDMNVQIMILLIIVLALLYMQTTKFNSI